MRENDGWEDRIVEVATRGGWTYFEGRGKIQWKAKTGPRKHAPLSLQQKQTVLSGGGNLLWPPRQLGDVERTLLFKLEDLDLDPSNAI